MSKTYVRHGHVEFWTQLPAELVEEALVRWGEGELTDGRFLIDPEPHALGPVYDGRVRAADGGTHVEIHFAWDPVWLAAIVVGVVMLGPFVLFALFFLSSGQKRTRRLLESQIRHDFGSVERGRAARQRLHAAPLSDPTDEGAAAAAPRSFAVRTGLDHAEFHLKDRRARTTRTLRVERGGLRFADGRQVSWSDIRRVRVQAGDIVIERVHGPSSTLALGGHHTRDVAWLAEFLEARRTRWAASPEEAAHARARLASVQAGRHG